MALSNGLRPKVSGGGEKGEPAAGEFGAPFSELSTLCAFLRETAFEDEKARETGSLLIFPQDGLWKAMLNDRDSSSVAFVSAETLMAALRALDKGLVKGTLDWRPSKGGKAVGRRAT